MQCEGKEREEATLLEAVPITLLAFRTYPSRLAFAAALFSSCLSPLSSLSMASSSAIRFVTGTKKSPLGSLHLQLHVKPGASKNREGVIAITDDAIELCVAAQA